MASTKLGGVADRVDRNTIPPMRPCGHAQVVGRYLIEIWKAVGMDMERVEFLSASGGCAASAPAALGSPWLRASALGSCQELCGARWGGARAKGSGPFLGLGLDLEAGCARYAECAQAAARPIPCLCTHNHNPQL